MGQRVRAVVTPVEGADANDDLAAEPIGCAREKRAHFEVPRTVEFGAVPRLPSGKILERALLYRHEGAGLAQQASRPLPGRALLRTGCRKGSAGR